VGKVRRVKPSAFKGKAIISQIKGEKCESISPLKDVSPPPEAGERQKTICIF
jgi:hypothetical protein